VMLRRSLLISSIGTQSDLTNHRCIVLLDRSLTPSPSLMLPHITFKLSSRRFLPRRKARI
jgi:hypothetical protein